MTFDPIRAIAAYEVPLLVPEARAFFAEAPIAGTFNEAHFVRELTALVGINRAIVLACGSPFRGAIGGVLYNDLATGALCCMEYFWFVSKAERGTLGLRLLEAFERTLIASSVTRLSMMHLCSEAHDSKFADLYGRRHYTLKERVFVKELA